MTTIAYPTPTSTGSAYEDDNAASPRTATLMNSLLGGLEASWFELMDALAYGFEDKAYTPTDPAGTFSSWLMHDN
jgi:hypothetical protein